MKCENENGTIIWQWAMAETWVFYVGIKFQSTYTVYFVDSIHLDVERINAYKHKIKCNKQQRWWWERWRRRRQIHIDEMRMMGERERERERHVVKSDRFLDMHLTFNEKSMQPI